MNFLLLPSDFFDIRSPKVQSGSYKYLRKNKPVLCEENLTSVSWFPCFSSLWALGWGKCMYLSSRLGSVCGLVGWEFLFSFGAVISFLSLS